MQGEGCKGCGVGEMCKGRDAGGVVWVRCARGGMQGVWCGCTMTCWPAGDQYTYR